MSVQLILFAKSYVSGRISADIFSEAYMELWKIERDNCFLNKDGKILSESLFSIFCLADMYNGEDDKEDYEFDADLLLRKVGEIISNSGF
ncbi:colicin immunity protein [Alcaligenaceae bacterium SJ-26]|nr:colicin immunity protein [Alcaligenaceae bacterium SJ-26]